MKHPIFNNNNSSYQASRLQRATRFVFEQNRFSFSFEVLTPNRVIAMSQQVFVPFLLTLFAGISTGIGSTIAFFATYGIRRNTLQIEHNCCEGNIPLIIASENRS